MTKDTGWGMRGGDLIAWLNGRGYRAYAASVSPIGSAWDRACELYAQLAGTRVDYGTAHSKEYRHQRYGQDYDWLKENKIPDGYTDYSAFTIVQDETDQKAMAMFEDPKVQGHDADLIRALYHAYLDWDTRNAAGVEPLRATIKDIESISSMEELNDFLCDPERSFGVPTLISFGNMP